MAALRGLLCVLCAAAGFADVYMQNPRGGNNKLNEVNNGRANANRLFDSQNNGNAGYQVGDACSPSCNNPDTNNPNNGDFNKETPGHGEGIMKYYAGSYLQVEWTSQHGCGADNPWVNCEIVLQYACDDTLTGKDLGPEGAKRDGLVRDGKNTNTIGRNENDNANNGRKPGKAESLDLNYGQHESYDWFMDCKARERNKGLFTANRLNSNTNQQTATYTRQNSNANRYGFECAEERDYYPYWHPTPWRDIAVLTDNTDRCNMYKYNSQNVRNKGYCHVTKKNGQRWDCNDYPECREGSYNQPNNENRNRAPLPNNRDACEKWSEKEADEIGTWYETGAYNMWEPECLANKLSRINHHGNVDDGEMDRYVWQIPDDVVGKQCVLRLRYNITTSDFDGWSTDASSNNGNKIGMKTDPTADFIGGGQNNTGPLTLSVNTAQFFRTFEDRTHVFEIMPWDAQNKVAWPYKIFNFNVRGRRGNIQQVYPAVEYDFVYPKEPEIGTGDFLHFQWTGSDANPTGNAGNGRQGTDRSNFVQVENTKVNRPKSLYEDEYCVGADEACNKDAEGKVQERRLDIWSKSMFDDQETVEKLAFLNQGPLCDFDIINTIQNAGQRENSVTNCGYINSAPAYFDGGLVQMNKAGTFHFMSTRNNAFSNRAQKGEITIRTNWIVTTIGVMSALTLCAAAAYGLWFRFIFLPPHVSEHPNSAMSRSCCGRAAAHRQRRLNANEPENVARMSTSFSRSREAKDEATFATEGATAIEVGGAAAIARQSARKTTCCDKFADKFDNWWGYEGARFRVVLALLIVNVTMFLYGYIRHASEYDIFGTKLPGNPHRLDWYPYAKAGGAMLNLNCSLILIPVLRNLLSWMRTTPIGSILPLDDNIFFHYLIAGWIGFATLLHVGCHYADFVQYAQRGGHGVLHSALFNRAGLTGHAILIMMILMFVTGLERVRRRRWSCCGRKIGGYTIFWNFHILWVPVMLLLWLHGPVFWIFNHWPLMLMILEKALHAMRKKDPVRVQEVRQLDGDVMQIKMQLASGKKFKYAAGQYIRLLCPELDSKEWHPFTLTSAPEQDFFSCHIRCRKDMDWTYALRQRLNPTGQRVITTSNRYAHADSVNPMRSTQARAGLTKNDSLKGIPNVSTPAHTAAYAGSSGMPQILVDGPYGSASEEVFQYRTLILVGAGIGVTPFVSIMRSLVLQHKYRQAVAAEDRRGNNGGFGDGAAGAGVGDDLQVHFFWCCRNRQEFNSFKGLLKDDIRSNSSLAEHFVFNLYMSGEVEVTSGNVQKELDEYAKWTKLFTGRPNWNRIFKGIRSTASPGEHIGVFMCGPAAIASQLKGASRRHSDRRSAGFTQVVNRAQGKTPKNVDSDTGVYFDFHKENF